MATATESNVILSNDVAALVVDSANHVALADKSIFSAVDTLATALGLTPTFAHWEAVRNAWGVQYKLKAQCTDEARDMAWSRVAKMLEARCGLSKPKAGGEAKKKAEQRSEAAKAVEAEINAAGGDAAKLADAAAKATKAGDASKAKVLVSALEKIQKETASKAKKAAIEAHKAKLEKLRELIKTADDAAIDKLIGVLTGELVVQKKRTK